MSHKCIFGLAGFSNSGKTTLALSLIKVFRKKGYSLGTIKHAHHNFNIDKPGKDSWKHREAGSQEIIVSSSKRIAHIIEHDNDQDTNLSELISLQKNKDIILVEGFKKEKIPKIEVWRENENREIISLYDKNIFAIATDNIENKELKNLEKKILDSQTQMKEIVANAAIKEVKSDMILGLGSGSTAALMIKSLADEIRSGKLQNIKGVATSFQSEVLALELDIPLIDLASVSQIDLAIDGADEVDPGFQLIKGGGACHVREKLVASKANQLLIVVDETKLVQNLNQSFPLPVEVLPNAWKQVQEVISEMNGSSSLRMAIKKAGPVVTDQGNLILDVLFNDGIKNPKDIEMTINNIPGVLENGLFVDLTDKVLVGKIEDNVPVVYSPSRAS